MGLLSIFLLGVSFHSHTFQAPRGACDPNKPVFKGYTFLIPEIINKNAAYAPFMVSWEDYYQRVYFNRDIQKEDNVVEWCERFCSQPEAEDAEFVIYKASITDLAELQQRITSKDERRIMPYPFGGNTFAEMLVLNKCTEVIDYLMFARRCEPFVVSVGGPWNPPYRDPASMQRLIDEGTDRFNHTSSHYLKLRYAYQLIRLAHYNRAWEQTVRLFNDLLPKIDRKKPSIMYYWILGHVAGALQQMGRYPEAAYRYAVIFRLCPSKRTQAFRSFKLRNDKDWKAAYDLCKSDADRATLYLMRAGRSKTFTVPDLAATYALDPGSPQLDLLLISNVQDLEKIFLYTDVTEKKYGYKVPKSQWKAASQQLIDLQNLTRRVIRENKCANPQLWKSVIGYLELLAGDYYAATISLKKAEKTLGRSDYERNLQRQIDIWRVLLEIVQINPNDAYADQAGFRVRSYKTFKDFPLFEPFLQDWLSAAYAAAGQPGKAVLAAFPPQALTYNPDPDAIDNLLQAADEDNPIFMEKAMQMDTNPDRLRAYLMELKGAYYLSLGQPEAAITIMQKIPKVQQVGMTKFSPFREILHERIDRPITDTLLLNRLEVADKLMQFEFKARAAAAQGQPEAAWYYYLIGLGYYNMSYFGYAWKTTDFFRSGANWNRLPVGPVFPLDGSPAGNRENVDMNLPLSYFQRALELSPNKELGARAAFMAARCRQKQWFSSPNSNYRPGNKNIPVLPDAYSTYYDLIKTKYKGTDFYKDAIKECKWLDAYTR
ncbi:MAG: hypothetical protein IPL65_12375 [Lewinellaceae bacterium]|nr:hypothetical protein [Lewinellaceae bacterium]